MIIYGDVKIAIQNSCSEHEFLHATMFLYLFLAMLTGILAAYCVKGAFTFNDSYSALRVDLSPDFNKDTCSGKSSTLITV